MAYEDDDYTDDELGLEDEESIEYQDFRDEGEFTDAQLDDLLYDPKADDLDRQWLEKRRGGRPSDAILSCPSCLGTVCVDCQQHEVYSNQYRAMFVVNCSPKFDEILRAQGQPSTSASVRGGSKKKKQKGTNVGVASNRNATQAMTDEGFKLEPLDDLMRRESTSPDQDVAGQPSLSGGISRLAAAIPAPAPSLSGLGLGDSSAALPAAKEEEEPAKAKQPSREAQQAASIAAMDSEPGQDVFHPVVCCSCGTEIGVYEPQDEVYHFFEVLATES